MNVSSIPRPVRHLLFVILWIGITEGAFRLLLTPSPGSFGRILGQELPPQAVLPWGQIERDYAVREATRQGRLESQYEELVVDGRRITRGDLWGIPREDAVTGHAPLESARSRNGWWQSNAIGALSRRETQAHVLAGQRRVLLFGDSYTQGSRLPLEDSWAHQLGRLATDVEVVNFGVDGFGMGQSYLRYQQVSPGLEYDVVLLVWVPDVDLWRDINTIRYLGEGWASYAVNPRYVVEGDDLVLVGALYRDLQDLLDRNPAGAGVELRQHLRNYDRFYDPLRYEEGPVWDALIVSKIVRNVWRRPASAAAIRRAAFEPNSEAERVTGGIFRAMRRDVEAAGKEFHVIVLPSLQTYHGVPRQARDETVARLCSGFPCLSLLEEIDALTPEEIDFGYDGSHYGRKTSRRVAAGIESRLWGMTAR